MISWARLTANWPLKLTSLLLAVLLWLVAAFEQPSSRLVRVQLQIAPPAGRELLEAPAVAQALVVGSTRSLLQLDDRSLILEKAIPDTVTSGHATLTLAPADIVLPRDLTVDVRDIQPREIMVRLDSLYQRLVPVRAVLRGGEATAISLTPSEVSVSGPVSAVRRVTGISTVPFDLPVGDGGDVRVALDTAVGKGIRVTPVEVTVHLRGAGQ